MAALDAATGAVLRTFEEAAGEERFTSALDPRGTFSHTPYTFPKLIAVCEQLARQAVTQAGGTVERDAAGREVFVVPVQTPTPMPLQIVGLAFYRTPVGSLWCMGEVLNERDEFLELVQLRITLYNVDGERVDEAEGFTATDVVPGLGRAPFALLFPNPPADGFASHEVVVVGAEPLLYWGGRHRDLVVEEREAGSGIQPISCRRFATALHARDLHRVYFPIFVYHEGPLWLS